MMHTNEFEEAFSNFLERHEYDEAENYLFSMVRLAFVAGWKAAGGDPPRPSGSSSSSSRRKRKARRSQSDSAGPFKRWGAQSCAITAWNRR